MQDFPLTVPELPSNLSLRVVREAAPAGSTENLLSVEERRRQQSFRSDLRRRCFVLGRTTLRSLLAERLGVEPLAVPLTVAPDGALEVGIAGLYASIGHALLPQSAHQPEGDMAQIVAIAAVSERSVGVDIEAFKLRRNDLYERILTPEEYPLLQSLGIPQERAQIVLWSLKEAALKANRTGLRLAMRHVGLEVDPERGRAVCTLPDARRLEGRYDIRDEFVVAIAFSA